MRADWAAIEKTGGRAAREKSDPVIEALGIADDATVVDIGANTWASLMAQISELATQRKTASTQSGVMVVLTAEPGALTGAPVLLRLARPWANARFVLQNRMRGEVDPKQRLRLADAEDYMPAVYKAYKPWEKS